MFSLPWVRDKNFVVAVIGDVILDEYLIGSVDRISPEAPVPVHLIQKTSFSAGGSANAALNITLSKGSAVLFSVWGDDEAAAVLKDLLDLQNVCTKTVQTLYDRPTIKKTRIMAMDQQMIRIDWEKDHEIPLINQNILLKQLEESVVDGILISDYGKGLLPAFLIEKIIEIGLKKNVPIVVDPKAKDFTRYRGCDVITPNKKEAMLALGLDLQEKIDPKDLILRLKERYGLKGVLLTMGSEGMMFHGDEATFSHSDFIYKKPKAREVYDVSGAGDTVASILTLALSAKSSIEEAMNLANIAAGLVVEKVGTQPVSYEELEKALYMQSSDRLVSGSSKDKIFDPDDLTLHLRLINRKIVFTNGCFDLLHPGHVSYLEEAKQLGQVLVVALNTDASIKRLKGQNRPILDLSTRMRMMAALESVDYVTWFDEDTPLNLIKKLAPDILVKASDYTASSIVGADVVKANGGQVLTLGFVSGFSTTDLIKKINS